MNLWLFAGVNCVRFGDVLVARPMRFICFGWWTKMRTTDVRHMSSEGVLIKYTKFVFNLCDRGLGVET